MKKDILKSLAMRAKNRMINKGLRDSYSNNIKIIENDDKQFYDKVKEMMATDSDICNPLKRLMDENKLMHLDARGKERYLLETIEKYHKARKVIENESCFG